MTPIFCVGSSALRMNPKTFAVKFGVLRLPNLSLGVHLVTYANDLAVTITARMAMDLKN